MRIFRDNGKKAIDFKGTIIFTKNDCAIRLDELSEEDPLAVMNVNIVGKGKNRLFDKIRNCIRLYRFMSAKG